MADSKTVLLQGTLDLLILRALSETETAAWSRFAMAAAIAETS